jgi:hypothetical protein
LQSEQSKKSSTPCSALPTPEGSCTF